MTNITITKRNGCHNVLIHKEKVNGPCTGRSWALSRGWLPLRSVADRDGLVEEYVHTARPGELLTMTYKMERR